MINIAALITCHNRKDKTLLCLAALFQNILPKGYALDVYLVDDGSIDGTGDAVKANYPTVNIIIGDGNLYWNGGMRVAFATAMQKGFDYYLWLNDDTFLYPEAIECLLTTAHSSMGNGNIHPLVVGSTENNDGNTTYGGYIRSFFWCPLKFKLVEPKKVAVECDTTNGNCLLISNFAALRLGNLDKHFIHQMGDLDYGLRAKKEGLRILVMPGYAGRCERNLPHNTFMDKELSVRIRLQLFMGKKGIPFRSWLIFSRRHGGFLWWLYLLWPFVKVVFLPIFIFNK